MAVVFARGVLGVKDVFGVFFDVLDVFFLFEGRKWF